MRILLISARYFPHRGGLESVVSHLAQEFRQQGHTVQIITNRYPRTLSASEEVEGIHVTRLHFLRPDWRYLRYLRFDLWLAGLCYYFCTKWVLQGMINKFQPDVINNHYLNEVAEFTGRCLAKHSTTIPWIISFHGGDVDGEPLANRSNKERFGRFSRQANRLTSCSSSLAIQAKKLEPALRGKIEVIYNGVDVERFADAKPCLADRPYILAVGQLAPHKGFDLLIEAFSQVVGNYPTVQLWIAGDGAQKTKLETLIRQKSLSGCIQLLGKVDETMVASLMAGSLFIAMPSRRDAFGIVALEGMAAGKAVLASPVGGLPEFLPIPPNRLVDPELPAWVAALNDWLALSMNGELVVDGNRKEALQYSWENVSSQYMHVYDRAIRHD